MGAAVQYGFQPKLGNGDRFQSGSLKMRINFGLETGDFSPKLKWGLILARNLEIEIGDFGPELKWGPILAQNLEIETGGKFQPGTQIGTDFSPESRNRDRWSN
ncbi:hypothetical protein GLOIN_2v1766276 [Rhizophagus irregularis DAOM 181602=DAOM 197198]|nr:hypothetical protein GLOIN_2v1766276 [Rhizophagus irregularis DAOM 181602=DAOM 197198]